MNKHLIASTTLVLATVATVVGASAADFHLQKNPKYFGSRDQVYLGASTFAAHGGDIAAYMCKISNKMYCSGAGFKFVSGPCSKGFTLGATQTNAFPAFCFRSLKGDIVTLSTGKKLQLIPGGSVQFLN